MAGAWGQATSGEPDDARDAAVTQCRVCEVTFFDLRNGLGRKRGSSGARNVKIIFALKLF